MRPTVIGAYGPWAASLTNDKPGAWKNKTKAKLLDLLALPDEKWSPKVKVHDRFEYDGLSMERLSWQLPYGPRTEALFLKPADATGKLPAVLALHDHGGNKYFGYPKITRTPEPRHPLMQAHHERYYEGRAWANDLASRGYAVLVHDAFLFGSRRVRYEDTSFAVSGGKHEPDPMDAAAIVEYNNWAGGHEHTMAKSLFCAGTTWPGVFFMEDRWALDYLCSRSDVDASRVGCGGLSGGGLRTVFLAGLDNRIKCAVPVGFMSTWKDFLLNKSHTHTWMTYVPHLSRFLDFPEILALRAPLPSLVLNDSEDQLFTLPEMKRAGKMIEAVYRKAGASKSCKVSFHPGPHKFDRAMQQEAFEWWDRWLK